MYGVVKWFNDDKGYGFVIPEDRSSDVFVHISDLMKSGINEVKEGQRLQYEIGNGRNGRPCAQKIRLA